MSSSNSEGDSDYVPPSSTGDYEENSTTTRGSLARFQNGERRLKGASYRNAEPMVADLQGSDISEDRENEENVESSPSPATRVRLSDSGQRNEYPVKYLMEEIARLETGASHRESDKLKDTGPKVVLLPWTSFMRCARWICEDPTNTDDEYRLRVHSRQKAAKSTRAGTPKNITGGFVFIES